MNARPAGNDTLCSRAVWSADSAVSQISSDPTDFSGRVDRLICTPHRDGLLDGCDMAGGMRRMTGICSDHVQCMIRHGVSHRSALGNQPEYELI